MYKSIKTTRDGCSLASLLKLTGFARSGYIQVSQYYDRISSAPGGRRALSHCWFEETKYNPTSYLDWLSLFLFWFEWGLTLQPRQASSWRYPFLHLKFSNICWAIISLLLPPTRLPMPGVLAHSAVGGLISQVKSSMTLWKQVGHRYLHQKWEYCPTLQCPICDYDDISNTVQMHFISINP